MPKHLNVHWNANIEYSHLDIYLLKLSHSNADPKQSHPNVMKQ